MKLQTKLLVLNEVLSAIKLVFSYYTQKSQNKYLEYFDLHVSTLKISNFEYFCIKNFLPLSLLSVIISVAFAISNGVVLSQAAVLVYGQFYIKFFIQSSISKNFIPSYNQVRDFNNGLKNIRK